MLPSDTDQGVIVPLSTAEIQMVNEARARYRAQPLLSCECIECPSHRTEREARETEVARLEARVAALTAAIRAVKQYTEQEPTANYGGAVTLSPEWFRMLAALDAAAGG